MVRKSCWAGNAGRIGSGIFCKPVVVSPITLKIRSSDCGAGGLPPDVDSRQMSLFGAGWSLGSIARLATTGHVQSPDLFRDHRLRGVIADEQASKSSDQFHRSQDRFTQCTTSSRTSREFPGKQIHPTHSSHPLITEGLTLVDSKGPAEDFWWRIFRVSNKR